MLEEASKRIRERILAQLEGAPARTDSELRSLIEEEVFRFSESSYLTADRKWKLVERVFHSFRGLDILQPLLEDPDITEIMINSHEEIFIEQNGAITRVEGRFDSKEKLEDVIQAVVAKVNRTVNESSPIVDARLSDGSRVNVVLPPVALKGPTMTIRKFPSKPMTMIDLIAKGALTERSAADLSRLVECKYNIFIGGGTGSGKTTFLNALAGFIPEDERIVTIEDSAELQIRTIPNLVGLETRNANTEGRGEITIRDLIRSSLRMRPNRILVGEVRGAEALDMLSAMNTGHEGSISTGHANSSIDMLSRLETMVLSGAELPLAVVRKQIASALDILIHLSRMRDKSRKVTEIHEVLGVEDGEIRLNPLYLYEERENGTAGLVRTRNPLLHVRKLEHASMKLTEGEEL
ncbi:ATPase, T2SS/T4P/T4SS family [Gorillibacterium sp. CAU 1737]|uniref:CpaF family protein n=1 Tax=Gorillibacterium sp. CAU 1737 TaxID=3140362 RepID=UPI003260F90E